MFLKVCFLATAFVTAAPYVVAASPQATEKSQSVNVDRLNPKIVERLIAINGQHEAIKEPRLRCKQVRRIGSNIIRRECTNRKQRKVKTADRHTNEALRQLRDLALEEEQMELLRLHRESQAPL